MLQRRHRHHAYPALRAWEAAHRYGPAIYQGARAAFQGAQTIGRGIQKLREFRRHYLKNSELNKGKAAGNGGVAPFNEMSGSALFNPGGAGGYVLTRTKRKTHKGHKKRRPVFKKRAKKSIRRIAKAVQFELISQHQQTAGFRLYTQLAFPVDNSAATVPAANCVGWTQFDISGRVGSGGSNVLDNGDDIFRQYLSGPSSGTNFDGPVVIGESVDPSTGLPLGIEQIVPQDLAAFAVQPITLGTTYKLKYEGAFFLKNNSSGAAKVNMYVVECTSADATPAANAPLLELNNMYQQLFYGSTVSSINAPIDIFVNFQQYWGFKGKRNFALGNRVWKMVESREMVLNNGDEVHIRLKHTFSPKWEIQRFGDQNYLKGQRAVIFRTEGAISHDSQTGNLNHVGFAPANVDVIHEGYWYMWKKFCEPYVQQQRTNAPYISAFASHAVNASNAAIQAVAFDV